MVCIVYNPKKSRQGQRVYLMKQFKTLIQPVKSSINTTRKGSSAPNIRFDKSQPNASLKATINDHGLKTVDFRQLNREPVPVRDREWSAGAGGEWRESRRRREAIRFGGG